MNVKEQLQSLALDNILVLQFWKEKMQEKGQTSRSVCDPKVLTEIVRYLS
jgi:hypothetical protein